MSVLGRGNSLRRSSPYGDYCVVQLPQEGAIPVPA